MAKVVNLPLNTPIGQDESDEELDVATTSRSSQVKSVKISMLNPLVSSALDDIDKWSFDAFLLADLTGSRPLFVIGQTLFTRYGFIHTFHIPPSTVTAFLTRIEEGYGSNDYHNSIHATDVTQTMHYFISISGLTKFLTNLECFASLFASIIHDYNHNGRTNRFMVVTGSDRALLYNDRSVQENHHLSSSFFILKIPECNIIQNLTQSQYRDFRTMVIDMVLSTDMTFHYQLMRDMKARLNDPSPITDKIKVMAFALHTADLGPGMKMWSLQVRWVERLFEEFFKQGDMEKELGIPVSALCDRDTTVIAESQVYWINFVTEPLITTCTKVIERVLHETGSDAHSLDAEINHIDKPWVECIRECRKKWKNRFEKDMNSSATNSKSRGKSK